MKQVLYIAFLFLSLSATAQNKAVLRSSTPSGIGAAAGGITASYYFNVATYGANPNDTGDDTPGIQAALNACVAAGGGTVYFPMPRNLSGYHYLISGALQTAINSTNPNCQLYIPLVQAASSMVTVKLLGEAIPNFFTEGVEDVARNSNGCILESTIIGTGTTPTVIGSPWYNAGITGLRNYIKVDVENLIIRTRTMTGTTNIAGTMTALNFSKLNAVTGRNFKLDISSTLTNSVLPSNETYGMMLPLYNNKVELSFDGVVYIEGYKYGTTIQEHANFKHLIVLGCVNGLVIETGAHTWSIQHLSVEVCKVSILGRGTCHGVILLYETEHYTDADKWFQFSKDLGKQSGTSEITILRANVVRSYVGRDNTAFVADAGITYYILSGAGKNVTL